MRYWLLHELRRLRAARRVGTITAANATRERKGIIKELVKIRMARPKVE